MATNIVQVDVRSGIAKYIYDFAKGYITTQIYSSIRNNTVLYLNCVGDEVTIMVSDEYMFTDSSTYSMGYVMQDPKLITIVNYFAEQGIDIDSIYVYLSSNSLLSAVLNKDLPKDITLIKQQIN